jgi:hypothetical protein
MKVEDAVYQAVKTFPAKSTEQIFSQSRVIQMTNQIYPGKCVHEQTWIRRIIPRKKHEITPMNVISNIST